MIIDNWGAGNMTEYKLLKVMKDLSKVQADEIHLNDVLRKANLNKIDFDILLQNLFDEGYIEATRLTIYLDSVEYLPDFRITNKGNNFLRSQRKLIVSTFMNEFKNWLALLIAAAAFIKSFFY